MADREKVIKGLERCQLINKVNCDKCPYDYNGRGNGKSECTAELADDALALLKEQEAKPLRCNECSYHRNDGWCNEHGIEVKESDFCSFGAWEGR